MEEILVNQVDFESVDYIQVLFSFFLASVFAFLIRFFYITNSNSIGGKLNIGNIIPILVMVVFLVITVVKSSLALSLGLVGALSIVRFRTPIKEPEELVYLFLAIATGLGFAANQNIITSIILSLILIILNVWLSKKKPNQNENVLLINLQNCDGINSLNLIMDIIKQSEIDFKMIRSSINSNSISIVLQINSSSDSINKALSTIIEKEPDTNITFAEPNSSW